MPCVISDEELREYERIDNEKLFGERKLTTQITAEVACELARIFHNMPFKPQISDLAQRWIEHHKARDTKEGRPWK